MRKKSHENIVRHEYLHGYFSQYIGCKNVPNRNTTPNSYGLKRLQPLVIAIVPNFTFVCQ